MRKLILPDRFKKKGRLAYYTLAHKTGAMVLVGFYLDNSIDPNSFFVNYFAQCLYAPFSTYNFSLGGRLGSYCDINRMSELQDKLNEFDVFDKQNTFEEKLLSSCKVLNINTPRKRKVPKETNWKQKFQKPQNENICLTYLNTGNNGNFHFLSFCCAFLSEKNV